MKDLRRMAGLDGKDKKPDAIPDDVAAASRILADDPNMMNDMRSAFARYEGKSQSELMNELERGREEGSIDPNELARVAQRIAPMISEEQRRRMESVLSKLNGQK